MDGVDVKEFYRLSLPTVQADHCLSWSQDHKISLITSTSLHILEVVPNPSDMSADMCLKRSFIKPPDDLPTKNSDIDVNRLLCLLGQRNAYRLVLDVKLAPHLLDTKPLEPHFVLAEWSPARMYQDQRCLIATLTNTGCLKLYVPYLNNWIEVVDISQSWVDHCKTLWPSTPIDYSRSGIENTFATLQNRTSHLKITAFAWNKSVKDDKERFTYLATISHSGLLGFWKMPNLIDLACTGKDYNTQLVKTCETNIYNAHVLHWLEWNENECSIVIGDTHGLVNIVHCEIFNASVNVHTIKEIWTEKDHMQVSHISSSSFKCKKNERVVAVAKNCHIIVFLITQNGGASFCVHNTGGLPITGLEVMIDKSFIVCTLTGGLLKYSVDIDINSSLSLEFKVLTSSIFWNDLKCLGVAKSHNSHLWAFGVNLCKMYDHLLIRRPSAIVFCTVKSVEDPLLQLKDSMNANPQNIYLHENWESIEMMRMNKIKLLKAQNAKLLEYSKNLDTFSVVGLQFELWLARMFVAQLSSTDTMGPEACAYVTLVEELIMCHHACKFIFSHVNNEQSSEIDDTSLQSLSRLCLWLQAWLAQNKDIEMDTNGDITAENASTSSCMNVATAESVIDNDAVSIGSFDDALSSDSNSSYSVTRNQITKPKKWQHGRVPPNFFKLNLKSTLERVSNALSVSASMDLLNKEFCVICEQKVDMDIDWRFAVCNASHRLPRCCHCLGHCEQVPYRLCPVCPAVACRNDGCLKEAFCTFCDSILIVDEKFIKLRAQTPSEQTPSEQTPSEQTPSEQIPSEQTPSEQIPSEQTPSDQIPLEQIPLKQTPSEQTPGSEYISDSVTSELQVKLN